MLKAKDRFVDQHQVNGSGMGAHQKRYDDWKANQGKEEPAMPGGLLPPMPTGPMPKRRRRKEGAVTQKQIDHPWAYTVAWYEEIRNHTSASFSLQRIQFESILAWRTLFEVETEPWEIDVLVKLDRIWFSALPKDPKKGSGD